MIPGLRFCFLLTLFVLVFSLAISSSNPLAAQTPGAHQPPALATQGPAGSRQLQQLEPLKTLPGKGKRWALVIGVDKYADPQVSPLRGAANDARILADTLVRYAGFPSDQVILLATDQPVERQPTRVNLLRRLSNLAGAVPKDGLLLVSFSGHGMERGGQAFLLPTDAQISDQISFLEDTAISVSRMRELIRATGVGQVMVLLDACRNDPGGRADAPNNMTQAYVNGFNFDVRNREVQAFATIYATAVGQRAYEYTEKKQGYFTWAIVEALKGGGANTNGEVTLSELVRYVQDAVPKRIAIDLGSGKQQRPFATVEGYKAEELVLSAPGARSSTESAGVPSGNFVDPTAIELSFWDSIKNSSNPEDFKAYLEKYPDGQFVGLAKLRAQPTAPAASKSSTDPSTELAFWDQVKGSTNADDFKAYLKRFPNGMYADLVNNRLKVLEKDEDAKRAADEIAELTKSFRGSFGEGPAFYWPGELAVAKGKIEFKPSGPAIVGKHRIAIPFNTSWNNATREGNAPLSCSQLSKASSDKNSIREIGCGPGSKHKCRFNAESDAAAASALDAIREVCKPLIQVTPTDESRPGSLDGTINKTFKIEWGFRGAGGDLFFNGNLLIWDKKFQIEVDQIDWNRFSKDPQEGQRSADHYKVASQHMDCRAFKIARVDDFWIREIKYNTMSYRLRFPSAVEAADAMAEIQRICKVNP